MEFNGLRVLFIVSVLLVFVFQGELAAQRTLTITPTGQTIKVDSTLDLTAIAMDGSNPDVGMVVGFSVIVGGGSVFPLVDTTDTLGRAYTVFTAGTSAGASRVRGRYRPAPGPWTVGTVDIEVISGDIYGFAFTVSPDTLNVGEYAPIEIAAADIYGNTVTTYTNPDTIALSLTGSTADSLQVAWIVLGDSSSGLSAAIPDNSFAAGMCTVYVANQKAETVSGVTATDTAGHTGTSTGITWLAIGVDSLIIELLSSKVDTISTNDTTNIQVTAIDNFGNVTSVGLPMDVGLSASEAGIVFPDGTIQSLQNSGDSFSLVAEEVCSGLIITVTDTADASIYGSSNPIEVVEGGAGVEELPAVSNISVKFGSGEILYSVAKEGKVEIKVYNKAGIEVGTLVEGVVEPGYYKASLQGLDLPNDIYFVVMKGPEIARSVKTVLIK